MNQKVFLIHGWSVQETTTYQALHLKLSQHGFELHDICLGRFVTLEDNVEIRDIAKALHNALDEKLNGDWKQEFHIITHSTGALVAKQWIVHHYKDRFCQNKPLKNIIFLAAPHFGSRLAHHGRSMLAYARYLGDTGRQVLTALELGSSFSWEINGQWLDTSNWKDKGIRPFNLIGDKVKRDLFASKIFPAAYEQGSDMVVRVSAGNLNFRRFELIAQTGELKEVGKIDDIPFAALADYTHSGSDYGIMNSIKRRSTPEKNLNLKLILDCLKVKNDADYTAMRENLKEITNITRKKRPGFAQIDFRFRDEDGQPIDDYVFKLGVVVNGKEKPSRTVVHKHKNKIAPEHFTVFINMKKLSSKLVYFMEFDSESGSKLFSFIPDPFRKTFPSNTISNIISQDQTTQIDVILSRKPDKNLFVFHTGDDKNLHVRWNREGEIIKDKLKTK